MAAWRQIRGANAEFQVLEALRTNRQKRNRENAFIVEGVRNIDAALRHGWTIRSLLAPRAAKRSAWATGVADQVQDRVELEVDLFASLTERTDPPELLLVVEKRSVGLSELSVDERFVATVLDRPSSPGNIGTIIRSSDALGAMAVCVMGHAADPYDPASVRASTGSFFAMPIVEIATVDALVTWARANKVTLVATDEAGASQVDALSAPPVALLFGNETSGLSAGLLAAADATIAIAMRGTASSLNIAAAHAIVLHEATRTRRLS